MSFMTAKKEEDKMEFSILDKARGAFLGAAVGDALGWPNEKGFAKGNLHHPGTKPDFRRWARKSGGRFYSHEDVIEPGAYSDDTQLILAGTRSLLQNRAWWERFALREVPFWTLYERGAGRATKRAANMWLQSKAPWSGENKEEEIGQYFTAGGNGAAMRVLPHCVSAAVSKDFSDLSAQVVANAVVTHGHPRALVGALVYAYALWKAFLRDDTLRYGALIDATAQAKDEWGRLPDISGVWPGWREAGEAWSKGDYARQWEATVTEVSRMLHACQEAMGRGALSVDREVLQRIGVYDRRINGAGTVAGVASIFLASLHAADPINAVVDAAFARGTDTDTIASMTGAILGAVCGEEWLGRLAYAVQDAHYLREISERLVRSSSDKDRESGALPVSCSPITKSDLDGLVARLLNARPGESVHLPDSRTGVVSRVLKHKVSVKNVNVVSWQVTTSDGQTLYIKRISRLSQAESEARYYRAIIRSRASDLAESTKKASNAKVKLLVRDMARARAFYHEILGLRIVREAEATIDLEGSIALVQREHTGESSKRGMSEPPAFILCVEIHGLERMLDALHKCNHPVLTPIAVAKGQRSFRCADPDGNLVEVVEKEGIGVAS